MQKFVLNLIVVASVVALAPITANAEAEQQSTTSACAGFSARECLAEANCSFAVQWCKEQARACRARTAATAITPAPNPSAPAKTSSPAPVLPPGGAWIQNEYWPEACYAVKGRSVLCESDLTDAQRVALGLIPPPSPEPATIAPPVPTRSTPDCRRLVNENHPDCKP